MDILSRVFRWFNQLDLILMSGLVILLFLGSVTLYSASGENYAMVSRQGLHILLATIVMLLLSQVKSKTMQSWTIWVYGFGILLLILVMAQGHIGMGARRWLDLGVFRFQPSEIMKLAGPMMVARYFSDRPLPPSFKDIIVALCIVMLPVLLIVKQPDLGTSLLVASAGLFDNQ